MPTAHPPPFPFYFMSWLASHLNSLLCDSHTLSFARGLQGAGSCPAGACRAAWDGQQPLNASARWGCFFARPEPGPPVDPTYVPCGETLAGAATGTTFTGDPSQVWDPSPLCGLGRASLPDPRRR